MTEPRAQKNVNWPWSENRALAFSNIDSSQFFFGRKTTNKIAPESNKNTFPYLDILDFKWQVDKTKNRLSITCRGRAYLFCSLE